MIIAFLDRDHREWDLHLRDFCFAYNTALHTSTGASPAFLNLGRELLPIRSLRNRLANVEEVAEQPPAKWKERITQLSALKDWVTENLEKAYRKQSEAYNLRHRDVSYSVGDLVWKRNRILSSATQNIAAKLAPKYQGPHRSLGNHEFDDGVAGLIPFIQNATFPIVTANLDLSEQPDLAATNLKNSTVLEVNGRKIGVIGYLTPETKIPSSTENVIFMDEVEAIRKEVTKLREQGVDILIALGHSGFETDKKIAKEVEEIDLVIGGHTNIFLYRGQQPDVEMPKGFYPTEVIQKNGRKVYVVQAYAYTKYLGNFSASFDVKGEIAHIEGNPIFVDSSVMEVEDVWEMIRSMRKLIDDLEHKVIGKTRVFLDGDSKNCRRRECNMGNLICDALIDYNLASLNGWTDVAIAIQNSGSIRSSITRARNDEVTRGDIISVLPFGNVVVKASMTGEQILSMLEWSVHNLNDTTSTGNLFGAYLQYSGLQVVYNINQPPNSRVVSIQVRCAACRVPTYSELQKNATYTILFNDFLAKGGDGFHMLEDLETTSFGVTTADVLEHYFKRHSPVYPGVEWRITYIDTEKKNISIENLNTRNLGTTYPPTVAMTLFHLSPIIVWLVIM
ncbi:protein 5NUC-like [Pseudomyrmex gracilis]|uniref:protein 5NUC-like n=1 Tax=Pseudomyrmex gracilis TaxID=219809 RepID=UPI000994D6CB|nr:protein 5NUC-like [Pseudomyrmex gracilis]